MEKHKVLLKDGTVGTITPDSIDYQNPEIFIGEIVRVQLNDENGMPIEVEGRLVEVLEKGYALYTITQIQEGQLVHGINGYSRVRKCVHGNKYYAYISEENEDGEDFVKVSDDDEDHISVCCG